MKQVFSPSFFLKNRHLQTVYASFFRKFPPHDFFVEKFNLSDGDFIECYWYNKPTNKTNKPLVMLFHGLAGSYKSAYIQGMMEQFDKNGFDSVVVHFRSCSGVMNLKAKAYHSGKTDDALEYINSIKLRFSQIKLFGIGYSLGANMLLKLLGELKDDSPLTAAIAVSAPLMLDVCANSINKGFSKFYQKHLVDDLNKLLEQKYDTHDIESLIGLKKQDVKNLKTFWEFDEAYTSKINGFKSAEDYYEKCSSKQFLKDIKTNTLLIHSLDDPFMSADMMPSKDEVSSFVELEISKYGGHVGFVDGSLFKPKYWLEARATQYFKTFI